MFSNNLSKKQSKTIIQTIWMTSMKLKTYNLNLNTKILNHLSKNTQVCQNKHNRHLYLKEIKIMKHLCLMLNKRILTIKIMMLNWVIKKRRRRKRRRLLKFRMMSRFSKYNKNWHCSNSKNKILMNKLNNFCRSNRIQKGLNMNENNKNWLCNNNVKQKTQKTNYVKSKKNKKNLNVNRQSLNKFSENTNLKRKKKQNVNKKKRKRPCWKRRELKILRGKLEKISKKNQLKNRNSTKMIQPEVQIPHLIPTKAQNQKTLASWTTPPSTTNLASFLKLL